jgi:hypothetical protein
MNKPPPIHWEHIEPFEANVSYEPGWTGKTITAAGTADVINSSGKLPPHPSYSDLMRALGREVSEERMFAFLLKIANGVRHSDTPIGDPEASSEEIVAVGQSLINWSSTQGYELSTQGRRWLATYLEKVGGDGELR